MAVKKKIINIRVYFDGDQDAKEVFAEVIAQVTVQRLAGHEKTDGVD